MKRLWLIIFVVVFALLVAIGLAETDVATGTVRFVIDGDTIILADGRTVRYIGIDAPEIDHEDQRAQPFAYEAMRFNEGIVGKQNVQLEFDRQRRDRYGRLLAYVFTTDGRLAAEAILSAGLAHVLPLRPNLKYGERLLAVQRLAMESGAGKWQSMRASSEGVIGNRNSMRFHRKDCAFALKIAGGNRVSFATRFAAFHAGYAPCRACLGAGR